MTFPSRNGPLAIFRYDIYMVFCKAVVQIFNHFQALNAMLMSWYMVGYHSGYYLGLQHGLAAKSASSEPLPRPASHSQNSQQSPTPSDHNSAMNFAKAANQVSAKSPQQDFVPSLNVCEGTQQTSRSEMSSSFVSETPVDQRFQQCMRFPLSTPNVSVSSAGTQATNMPDGGPFNLGSARVLNSGDNTKRFHTNSMSINATGNFD